MEEKYFKLFIRIGTAIAIFLVVFYFSDAIRKVHNYDTIAEAIYYLAGVVAAGCYWIESREK